MDGDCCMSFWYHWVGIGCEGCVFCHVIWRRNSCKRSHYLYPALMFRGAVKKMRDKPNPGMKREVKSAMANAGLGIQWESLVPRWRSRVCAKSR